MVLTVEHSANPHSCFICLDESGLQVYRADVLEIVKIIQRLFVRTAIYMDIIIPQTRLSRWIVGSTLQNKTTEERNMKTPCFHSVMFVQLRCNLSLLSADKL